MKQTIRLTESQLKEKIGKIIRTVLREGMTQRFDIPQGMNPKREVAYTFLKAHLDMIFNELPERTINDILNVAIDLGFNVEEELAWLQDND